MITLNFPKLRKVTSVIVVLGVCLLASSLSLHIRPYMVGLAITVLTFLGLIITLGVNVIIGLFKERKLSRSRLAAALGCTAFMLAAWVDGPLGNLVADQIFKYQVDEYTAVVDQVKTGEITTGTQLTEISTSIRQLYIRAIKAARTEDGFITVAFLIDTDIPLLHHGYVYIGCVKAENCETSNVHAAEKLPHVRHVVGYWYHFSDQPSL